ncbi:MAG: CRISPR-associated endonuclease Cas1 [Bacteroidota bacterium]
MQLYLNTYGTYLHVKDAMFEIRVPAEEKGAPAIIKHLAAHKVKGIVMSTSAALSTDAVVLALKHNVDIVFSDAYGQPMGRVWHSKLGSTTRIRKRQLEASLDERAVHWTMRWLSDKLNNQVELLKRLKKHRAQHINYLDEKIHKIEGLLLALQQHASAATVAQVADQLRGLEGTAGRLYFEALSYLIPAQYAFSGRSFRPAQDAFNAFLNYAYGVLYGKVEKALIIAGLDPYLGFLHRDDYNYKSLVYDYIEPYRTYADEVVFKLFAAKKVNQQHTDELANGLQLNKEGKVLLLERLTKYLEEDKIKHRGRNQHRANIIQLEAHAFANQLLLKSE